MDACKELRELADQIEQERALVQEIIHASKDFFSWFNRHYPEPSMSEDHPWNRLGMALNRTDAENR